MLIIVGAKNFETEKGCQQFLTDYSMQASLFDNHEVVYYPWQEKKTLRKKLSLLRPKGIESRVLFFLIIESNWQRLLIPDTHKLWSSKPENSSRNETLVVTHILSICMKPIDKFFPSVQKCFIFPGRGTSIVIKKFVKWWSSPQSQASSIAKLWSLNLRRALIFLWSRCLWSLFRKLQTIF